MRARTGICRGRARLVGEPGGRCGASRWGAVDFRPGGWRGHLGEWKVPVLLGLLLLLLSPFPAAAQDDPFPQGPPPRYLVSTLDGIDGATRVVKDGSGFLWFATGVGLLRYDGIEVRPYLVEEFISGVVAPNVITELTTDASGLIWASNRAGIVRLDPVRDTLQWMVGGPEGLQGISGVVEALALDPSGVVWFSLAGGPLCRWLVGEAPLCVERPEGSPGAPPSYLPADLQDAVMAMEPDGAGGLWVAFRNRLRHMGADGAWTEPSGGDPLPRLLPEVDPFQEWFRALRIGPSGRLWIGLCSEEGGLYSFDPETGELESFLLPNPDLYCTSSLEFDGADEVWMATLSGVARLELDSGDWMEVMEAPSQRLGFNPMDADGLFMDEGGILWIAHDEGVSRLTPVGRTGSPSPFHHVTFVPGWTSSITDPAFHSVAPSAGGVSGWAT